MHVGVISDIPEPFIIYTSKHWTINHRLSSALPGYLMLGSNVNTSTLADLSPEALAELGLLQARIQQVMEMLLKPKRLYIGRYGHDPGHPIHFHFIPVYAWVEALFWEDERYRTLQQFAGNQNAHSKTDGAELTLFVWREFCESSTPPVVEGPSIRCVIAQLREAFGQRAAGLL